MGAPFPDPALAVNLSPHWDLRVGGDLVGGGYRTASGTPVEFDSFRAGATLSWHHSSVHKDEFFAAAGADVEREFDFFGQRRRIQPAGAPYIEVTAKFR